MAADDFLDRFRRVLQEAGEAAIELDEGDIEAVLALARDVAHGTERRYAPLATFLAGQFVNAASTDPKSALQKARDLAREVLDPGDP